MLWVLLEADAVAAANGDLMPQYAMKCRAALVRILYYSMVGGRSFCRHQNGLFFLHAKEILT